MIMAVTIIIPTITIFIIENHYLLTPVRLSHKESVEPISFINLKVVANPNQINEDAIPHT